MSEKKKKIYCSRTAEVEACFKENPELFKKTLDQVGIFFLLQGELSSSYTRDAALKKARFYRNELWKIDPDVAKALDEKWEKELSID